MLTTADCILKADNYALVARTADTQTQRCLIRLAAIWRNRGLRLQLAQCAANIGRGVRPSYSISAE